jgi:hypothetical protein
VGIPAFFDAVWYYYGDAARRAEIDAMFCSSTACLGGSCWLNSTAGQEYCNAGFANVLCANGESICFLPGVLNDGVTNVYDIVDTFTQTPIWYNTLTYVDPSTGVTHPNIYVVNGYQHWLTTGHQKRYPPNPSCQLYPSLYDSGNQCAEPTPGCWPNPSDPTQVPCGAPTNGYCVKQYGAAYGTCQCNNFDSTFGIFAGEERFFGTACEYDGLYYSQAPNTAVSSICGGIGHLVGVASNVTYEAYTPDWYTPDPDVFAVNIQTEMPACDCENTGFDGPQCQYSRCGGCGSNYLQGICVLSLLPDNTTTNLCACGPGYTGVHCELAVPLLVGSNGLTCSGVASVGCIPDPTQPSKVDLDCTTHLNPTCLCPPDNPAANANDFACQGQICNSTVLIPGHGRYVAQLRAACSFPSA